MLLALLEVWKGLLAEHPVVRSHLLKKSVTMIADYHRTPALLAAQAMVVVRIVSVLHRRRLAVSLRACWSEFGYRMKT